MEVEGGVGWVDAGAKKETARTKGFGQPQPLSGVLLSIQALLQSVDDGADMVFQDEQCVRLPGPVVLRLPEQGEDKFPRLLDVLVDFLFGKHPSHRGNVVAPVKQLDHGGGPVFANFPVVGSKRFALYVGQPPDNVFGVVRDRQILPSDAAIFRDVVQDCGGNERIFFQVECYCVAGHGQWMDDVRFPALSELVLVGRPGECQGGESVGPFQAHGEALQIGIHFGRIEVCRHIISSFRAFGDNPIQEIYKIICAYAKKYRDGGIQKSGDFAGRS